MRCSDTSIEIHIVVDRLLWFVLTVLLMCVNVYTLKCEKAQAYGEVRKPNLETLISGTLICDARFTDHLTGRSSGHEIGPKSQLG